MSSGKYDLVIGNGCSFTEGGGLNNPRIYKFLTNKDMENDDGEIFMKENSYPKFLGDKFNCDYKNISESCSSNNFIIERAYQELQKHNDKRVLIINQLSMPTRLGFKNKNKYYSYNGMAGKLTHTVKDGNYTDHKFIDGLLENFDKFYKHYILDTFDINYHWEVISMQMDLFNSWCEKRNIDNYWVSWDEYDRIAHIERVIDCDGACINTWALENRYRLQDIPLIPHKDSHLSIEGHKQIANIIYEKIR